MKLTIGYFYPELLNLYGDHGNVEILESRARARGIDVEIILINEQKPLDQGTIDRMNLFFMGGGPDSAQESMYQDLINQKAPFIREYVDRGGVGLLICGSYQLFGHYYQAADGARLEGLGIFDLYTQHFGKDKPRCIGNVVATVNAQLQQDPVFQSVNHIGKTLVGFENHGGRTYLNQGSDPFATIEKGFGNNGEDTQEGAIVNNMIGTYLHGPLLSKNPHVADYLIAKAIQVTSLEPLDDAIIQQAHDNAKKLR